MIPAGVVVKQIGKYELTRELGHGQFATVYLANDTNTDGEVALKIIRKSTILDATLFARMKREGDILTLLEFASDRSNQRDFRGLRTNCYCNGIFVGRITGEPIAPGAFTT